MFYQKNQMDEIKSDPTVNPGQVEFAREIFAAAAARDIQFEKSRWPVDSTGQGRYQVWAKIGKWLVSGTLDGIRFTTELGSFNYLIVDFSGAIETGGIKQRVDELETRERRLRAWRDDE